jgi:hypothetical protein
VCAINAFALALGWIAGLRHLNCRLTVVKLTGPKRLTGPIQNGVWSVVLLLGEHTQMMYHRRKGRVLAILVARAERGKPLVASGLS